MAALSFGTAARAYTLLNVPTTAGADVSIKLSTPCLEPAAFGFMPVRITVENTAAQERTWRFNFQAGTRGMLPGILTSTYDVTIPAGQTRDTWVYVPTIESGEVGGAPTVGAAGITPGAPVAGPGSMPFTVTKAGNITKISRQMGGAPGSPAKEEIEINELTGEQVRTFTSGTMSSSTRNTPPAGVDITFFIDPATGNVNTRTTSHGPLGGTTKVTIVNGRMPGMPGGPPPTVTSGLRPMQQQTFKVTKTAGGVSVTRYMGSIEEERDIDTTTGVITTERTLPNGRAMTPAQTMPIADGLEVTFTIDPNSGFIRTASKPAALPTAPPKINVITPPGSTALQSASVGTIIFRGPAVRILPQSSRGPAVIVAAEVSGPGVAPNSRVQFPTLSADASMRPIAATPSLARVLEEGLKTEGIRTPNVATVELSQLPSDWRVWSPFATVLLSTDEYAALDVARRAALRGWVSLGGRLLLMPDDQGPKQVDRLGAGEVVRAPQGMSAAPSAETINELGISLGGNIGHPDRDALKVLNSSPLGAAAQPTAPATIWIGFFLVAFAAVVGPVNLFVFAPAAKRHRLFFTTPVISLCGVGVLVATIFVQDGVGGDGWRRVIVVFVPGDNEAAVFQEQGSRTGFLTRQGFPLADDTLASVLPFEDTPPNQYSAALVEFVRGNSTAAGSWFRSRNRQVQLLERLVPTRGRIERVATDPDGAPIVESSIAGSLRDFVLVGDDGTLWSTSELAPGRRVTLARGGTWIREYPLGGTRRLTETLLACAPMNAGHWCGFSAKGELAPIETLSSIRWHDADVVMTGTLEGGAQNQEARP